MSKKDFKLFRLKLLEEVKGHLPSDTECWLDKIEKNKGTEHVLVVMKKADKIAPCIYLSGFFQKHLDGIPMSKICSDILRMAQTFEMPQIDIEGMRGYEKVREQLRIRLVSKENNQEYLKQGPYWKTAMGAAVVYAAITDRLNGQAMGVRITNDILKEYGVTEGQLFQDALQQTIRNCPPTFQSMGEMIESLTGSPGIEDYNMYILTNRDKMYGAAVTLYPGALQEARRVLGEDFYVLPSSIHETILVKKSMGCSPIELRAMVRAVNREEVEPEEQLSNEVYEYREKEGRLLQCEVGREFKKEESIRVLLVKPGKAPTVTMIDNRLSELQQAVDGNIEMIKPFGDDVALICNEEGKLDGLPLNRGLKDPQGNLTDIVSGNFLLCRASEKDGELLSLTEEQIRKYGKMFRYPERFYDADGEVISARIEGREKERDSR